MGGACRPEASWGKFLSAPQLLSLPPFRTLQKSYGSLTEVFRIWFSYFFLFPFTNIKWNMLTQDFQKFYGSQGSPKNHFSTKRGGACRPVASSLSNPTSKIFWMGLDSNFYLHPILISSPPIFMFLAVFFPKSHETLQIPPRWVLSLPKQSTMVLGWNYSVTVYLQTLYFAKYTPVYVFLIGFFPKHLRTLQILQQWVLNILRWSNEGRIPTNNGSRMKLGYDSCPFLLIFYRR